MQHPSRILLGPQRPDSNLAQAVQRAAVRDGSIAVVSAGWQEAEGDIDDIHDLVGRPLVDLRLYQRANELFHAHPEFHDAYRMRQDKLKVQQDLYKLRLRHLAVAARQVMRSEADRGMVAAEQRHAVSQLRALDRHHLHRVNTIHAGFEEQFGADRFSPVAGYRAAIASDLESCQAVIITGGNSIVLLNRLLLFGVGPLLSDKPVIGWSAGAMVLCKQVVLFHDRLPEGRRDPEVLGPGLGLVSGHVVLPDAQRRIRDNDSLRLSLFARRFSPETCVLLDTDSCLQFTGHDLTAAESARRIKTGGSIGMVKAG